MKCFYIFILKNKIVQPTNKLNSFIAPNRTLNYKLRRDNPISVPRCKTERFKNSFIVAGMKSFNDNAKFKY